MREVYIYITMHISSFGAILYIMSVSIGVMVGMFALWDGGPKIDTWSGTFNGNYYFNGLIAIYIYIYIDR